MMFTSPGDIEKAIKENTAVLKQLFEQVKELNKNIQQLNEHHKRTLDDGK